MKKVIIIDGYNFFFRAFYAIRELTREDGLHTNALYGLTTMVLKTIEDLNPDICLVALDMEGNTFRSDIYPEYKANRSAPPEELMEQFEYMRPLLESLGLTVLEKKGFEADDIIATVANKIDRKKYELVIVSSDKDLMQLINGEVYMYDAMKRKEIKTEQVLEKFGVTPDKVVEVQGLIGDSVDNIPGVKSVGPKTASLLINEYDSLENLYENIENITKKKLKENLITYKEDAFISRKLATLDTEIYEEVSKYLQGYSIDNAKAMEYMDLLGFKTLSKKFDKTTKDASIATDKPVKRRISNVNYTTVNTIEELDRWMTKLQSTHYFAIDTETDSLNKRKANLIGVSLSVTEDEACYIPIAHNLDILEQETQLDLETVIKKLKPILANDDIIKVGQNIKYDMHILDRYGIDFNNIDDTMIMSGVLNGAKHRHNMDDLADIYLGHETVQFKQLGLKKDQTFADIDIKTATHYAAEDADITLKLYNIFFEKLLKDNNLHNVYNKIEKPIIKTLFNMEKAGVKVDREKLAKLSAEFSAKIKELTIEIHNLAGVEFNIASPKQLGEVLFDTLGFTGGKKTKTGWKTGIEVLEKLAEQGHEIAEKLVEFRHLSKLKSTYTDSLVGFMDSETNKICTSYHQLGASTGRFSSSDPNLQNIPIRTEDGQKIRECFIPDDGFSFVSIDYSQVELRLLASLANIEPLIRAFNNDKDIHSFTAKKIFGSDESEFRRKAKAVNFGIIYGMGPFTLAKQLGISNAEGKELINEYYNMFKGLAEFMSEQKQKAIDLGYVETYYGRKIFMVGASSSNKMVQNNSLRAATNAPMQGTSADIIKLAMPKIEKVLEEKYPTAKMLMQIHDELVFSIKDSEIEEVSAVIKKIMENVTDLKVKLKADIGVGKNWNAAH
ncbi:MAG: DNA polymerase I [Proteobacteria bacterium]|nr:DNA polymerase I [Pseudomonadota bacterium]